MFSALAGCAPAPHRDRFAGDWQVMTVNPGKRDMLCYAGASPIRSTGSMGKRETKAYLMATRRESGKIEISASAGYSFMPGSKAELAVDGKVHSLFYKDAIAWATSDAQDRDIINTMKTAEKIELRGVSKDGLTSVDYYPPEGFAAAIARIRELCP
jgi:hypothetical protein